MSPARPGSRAPALITVPTSLLLVAALGCGVEHQGLAINLGEGAPTAGARIADARADRGDDDAADAGPLEGGAGIDPTAGDADGELSEAGETATELDSAAADDVNPESDGGPSVDGSDGPAASPGEPPWQGLVLWLPLDHPPGSVELSDHSGQRNRVTLHDVDPAQAWVPGHLRGAVDLGAAGASTGHLRAETSRSINRIGGELTIAVWLWRTRGQPGVIVSRRASAAGVTLYRLSIDPSDHLRLLLNDRRAVRLDLRSTETVPMGRWVHTAVTCDRRTARLYIDGQPSGAAAYGVPFAPDVSPILIGSGGPGGEAAGFLPERLDELVIYERALSPAEVKALAGATLSPPTIE